MKSTDERVCIDALALPVESRVKIAERADEMTRNTAVLEGRIA
jgi:hypothetical protein